MITGDDFYTYCQPHECRRRVWLDANQPGLRADLTEFERILLEKGKAHEQHHLATLGEYVSPEYPPGDLQAGAQATSALVAVGAPVIYQGVLLAPDGTTGGKPDFLIREGRSYVIRDAKLALNLDRHPEIDAQVGLYAHLAQVAAGVSVARGEVVLGDGTIQQVEFADPSGLVQRLAAIQAEEAEPDEAVGWSKCDTCGFFEHCWTQALDAHDPAVVPDVSQSMRHVLRDMGIARYDDLPAVPVAQLAEVKIPWGGKERRIGDKIAEKVIRQVHVLMSGQLEVVAQPEAPPPGPIAYFDVESNPWDVGVETMVYLWGLLVNRGDGSEPEYWGEIADSGPDGDRDAWFAFLEKSRHLIGELGDLPFVHYSAYEQTQMKAYVQRWGDPEGVADQVLALLWDMKAEAVSGHLCLPVHSYGLKHVEQCAGFQRGQTEYGSLWSVGRYNACLLSTDPGERSAIRDELLSYNREDCLAMRHALKWACSLG